MVNYAAQIRIFFDAIAHEGASEMLPLIARRGNQAFTPQARLDVYRYAYGARLAQAVATDHEALAHLVGDAVLAEWVHAFVLATPSHWWDLNLYPVSFSRWLAQHSNRADAVALATLESAITAAFWAPDSAPLDGAKLADGGEALLLNYVFRPRASLRLLALSHAANAYLTAFRNEAPLREMAATAEYVAVLRHPHHVQRHVLGAQEYALLNALCCGQAFGQAVDSVAETYGAEALQEALPYYLERWLLEGFFAA